MVRVPKGLDGVVIDESRISMVDGEAGEIWYCGYSIDELAERSSFPELVFLLFHDRLPTRDELEELTEQLTANRALPPGVEQTIAELAPRVSPMDTLRTAVSMLAGYVDDPNDVEDRLNDHLLDVIAKMPTIVAATHRYRNGDGAVEPRDDLDHAANFLYMLHGEEPDADRARGLDTTLVLYAEHGMNASTFSAIVTASTLANPYAALTSAIGTLQGPLHGGATETVIEMLQGIGGPSNVEDWVDDRLDAGDRIPGFGHRVYKVPDPRCAHFRRAIEAIGPGGEVATWFATAERLREVMDDRLGEKGVAPNTDLYSGTFYNLLGIPPAFYTTVFASGRAAGWSAHVIEQLADNRLIRPRVEYVGDTGRPYLPVDER